ncbi:hypothetical protein [[Scytonema hofmanni] UTEX B 1581]|uniref:hypothetical protein n=1 Tax=[Scytonema hofmanni] UTEX B 1581 TaxID=379535 RepID=UPI0016409C7B|nr:hypothetical protein [[Scytonema hofmanni] UTEX B 1581]
MFSLFEDCILIEAIAYSWSERRSPLAGTPCHRLLVIRTTGNIKHHSGKASA